MKTTFNIENMTILELKALHANLVATPAAAGHTPARLRSFTEWLNFMMVIEGLD